MTDELKQRIANITDANAQILEIYALLDELNITYKKTKCARCRRDLLNILREEAGLIESAANESGFNTYSNTEYVYLLDRPQTWNGHFINQDTPPEVIRAFLEQFPNGYYKLKQNTTENE